MLKSNFLRIYVPPTPSLKMLTPFMDAPYNLFLFDRSLGMYPNSPVSMSIQIFSQLLAYGNSCVNSILYAFSPPLPKMPTSSMNGPSLYFRSLGMYPNSPFSVSIQIFSQLLAYGNSCVNPILYAFLSEPFRRGFCAVVSCMKPAGPHGLHG